MAALRSKKLVSGLEALQITGASMYLPREEHSALLNEFLQEAKNRPGFNGVPLFVTGSAQEHPYFYRLVETCGAVIVAEDHDWGTGTSKESSIPKQTGATLHRPLPPAHAKH